MKYIIGIDSGSTTTKGVLFYNNEILEKRIVNTGGSPKRAMREVFSELRGDRDVYTVTTGYGRELLEESDKKVTEITCHGIGASYLAGNIHGIIDIGGQDSKVIQLDREKNIIDFLMNDKCAAGTGRFIETIMRVLHQDIEDLDAYVREATPVKISSMCTVFAESEVISLLANGHRGEDIALGILESICLRTAHFARKLPLGERIFFSGGLARSTTIRNLLESFLSAEVVISPDSLYTGAIGAAIIGNRKFKGE